ncbi:hypothetical protein LCGC14_0195690 [marine sediment metagenome]|uniref:Uncharacterized protein n=1 Tax=marine sediment metagenome TaxID=412755 RepID=A0A0F9X4G3_9ZZZZ
MDYRDEDLTEDERAIILKIQKLWTEMGMIPVSVNNLYDLFIQIKSENDQWYKIQTHDKIDREWEKLVLAELSTYTIHRGITFASAMRLLMEYNFFVSVSFQDMYDMYSGSEDED